MSALGDLYKAGLAADGVNVEVFAGNLFGHKVRVTRGVQGELSADSDREPLLVVDKAAKVLGVYLAVLENGSDSVDPLEVEAVVKKDGTDVCSTNPKIDKSAASDAAVSTVSSGTGVTQAVVKSDGTEDLEAGDILTINFNVTRTTPDTEITTPVVTVVYKYTEA